MKLSSNYFVYRYLSIVFSQLFQIFNYFCLFLLQEVALQLGLETMVLGVAHQIQALRKKMTSEMRVQVIFVHD